MIARALDLDRLADDEAIVDLFAGFGGASTGIEDALGRSPDVAINHDALALRNHEANHPRTLHLREDLFRVRPFIPRGYRRIGILWTSPDCTHHSIAKGGKPRETGRRLLAWVVVEWARETHPRVIFLENVPEFRSWGPLDAHGKPVPERKGETFREFVAALELAGYRVEHRVLNCADYGSKTGRRRLFLVARCDGRPIVWPEPTHGRERAEPYRIAAQCVDFSIPCPSIFTRARPLKPATERRIAEGIRRYVLGTARPFIVCTSHGQRVEPIDEPLRTTTTARGGERALVVPSLVRYQGERRTGETPRVADVGAPLPTQTTEPRFGLVAAFLARNFGGPNGNRNRGASLEEPLHTVTAVDHHSLAAVHLTKFYGSSTGAGLDEPMPTVTAQAEHVGLVAAFLARYHGTGGQWAGLDEPLTTVTTVDRLGLVTVSIEGEEYVLTDIGFRMLQPVELARAHGFDGQTLIGTKRDQVRLIGNSVPREPVAALVRANLGGAVAMAAA